MGPDGVVGGHIDPDYLSATGTSLPLVASGEVYTGLRAVLDELESGAVPVVALRDIPGTDDLTTVNPDRFLYGFVSGDLRFDQVVGDDDTAGQQISRTGSLTVEEAI